jgi:hypothetical protein
MTPYGSPALRLLFAALKRSKLAISAEQLVDLDEVKAAIAEYEQVLANVKKAETDLKEFVVSTALRVSLRDGIHPVSAASNPNGKVDSRKCSVLGPPNTLPSNTLTPSGVADSHSTASNPTGKQGLGRPERFQGLNAPANREAVDKHRGAEKPLVSEPRPKAAAPASPSDSFVDKGFADHLIAAFVNGNRPVPTSLQIAQTQQSLPDEQEARLEFVDQLRQKMHKIKGPGVLAGEAQAFTTAWPMMVAKKEAQFAQQQPTEYSPVESLAIEIQFADTLPDHPDSVASRIVIAKAQMENPELYAAAVEFLANSKRMVS